MEQYGIEARDAVAHLILNHEVQLGYGDVARDGYGRLIASVVVGETDIAEYLLEQGLGHLFLIPPESVNETVLTEAQNRARSAHRGIWSTPRYRGSLHITSFHANARGDDWKNINGEYLRVCNVATDTIDLQGYSISDLSGHSWVFPELSIPVGYTVEIHSGRGDNQTDQSEQLELFLASDKPIWNNVRDRATIYDRQGVVVDARHHEPQHAPSR